MAARLRNIKTTKSDRVMWADAVQRAPHFQANVFAQMCVEGRMKFVTNGTVAVAMIEHPERLENGI